MKNIHLASAFRGSCAAAPLMSCRDHLRECDAELYRIAHSFGFLTNGWGVQNGTARDLRSAYTDWDVRDAGLPF
jgi:hypothetical protein